MNYNCNPKLNLVKIYSKVFGGIQKERFDWYVNVIIYEVKAKNVLHLF